MWVGGSFGNMVPLKGVQEVDCIVLHRRVAWKAGLRILLLTSNLSSVTYQLGLLRQSAYLLTVSSTVKWGVITAPTSCHLESTKAFSECEGELRGILGGVLCPTRVLICFCICHPLHSENVSGLRYVDDLGKWGSFLPFGIDLYILNVVWNTSMIC